MHDVDVTEFDEKSVLALIMGAVRAERFCDGALLAFFEDGCILKWLKRLKDIDWQQSHSSGQIIEVVLNIGGFFDGMAEYRFCLAENGAKLTKSSWEQDIIESNLSPEETLVMQGDIYTLHTEYWNYEYNDPLILDGTQWTLAITYASEGRIAFVGSNAYPNN